MEDNSIDLLLKPREKSSAFFHINIPEELDENLVYESELEVQGPGGARKSVKLEYGGNYATYTREEAASRIEQSEKEDNDENNIALSCSPDKEVFYIYENSGTISCNLINNEDRTFKDLVICFEEDCKNISLSGNEEKKISFQFNLKEKERESFVTLENHEVSRYSYFDLNIITSADVKITDLEYPKAVDYRENGEVKFTLVPNSKVNFVEVKVGDKKVFSKDELKFRNDFVVPFDGDFFFFRDPYIEVEYKDLNDKEHIVREAINIDIINAPWYAKIMRIFSF